MRVGVVECVGKLRVGSCACLPFVVRVDADKFGILSTYHTGSTSTTSQALGRPDGSRRRVEKYRRQLPSGHRTDQNKGLSAPVDVALRSCRNEPGTWGRRGRSGGRIDSGRKSGYPGCAAERFGSIMAYWDVFRDDGEDGRGELERHETTRTQPSTH
jgi:hypothetical protein